MVKKLNELSKGTTGVYLLEGNAPLNAVRDFAQNNEMEFFHLDGKTARTKKEFLQLAARDLKFPEYFGNNWDAFEDCLTDPDWHNRPGLLIFWDNFDAISDHSPDAFRTALQIFQDSAKFWADMKRGFLVLLHGKHVSDPDLTTVAL